MSTFLMSFKWRWRWWWKDLFQMMGRSPPHEVEVGKGPGKKGPRHYHPWQCNDASGHEIYWFWSLPRIHAWSLLSSWRSQFKTWKLQTLSGEGVYLVRRHLGPPGLLVNVALVAKMPLWNLWSLWLSTFVNMGWWFTCKGSDMPRCPWSIFKLFWAHNIYTKQGPRGELGFS